MTMDETGDTRDGRSDPLAELIRAAGRRAEPPAEHRDRVEAAARRAWRNKVLSRRRKRWFALAASVGLLVTSSILLTQLELAESGPAADLALSRGTIEWSAPGSDIWQRISGSGIALPVDSRLRTGDAAGAALTMAGGGSLRLDGNTEVIMGIGRVGLGAGRVYFDSAGRSPSMPIAIETPIGTVRDIGTQFEVSLRAGSLQIRVREGEIAFVDASASGDVTAASGEEVELSAGNPPIRRPVAPDDAAWGWAEALASPPEVASRSILVYFRWIARETGRQLEFEPETVELAAELATFSGDPAGLSPLELLSQIAATSDFDYRLTEDGAILIGRN